MARDATVTRTPSSEPKVYYHGTREAAAWFILAQGFKIAPGSHGRARGRGIYLGETLSTAAVWGDLIVRCHLMPGTRMLWVDGHYDQKVIDSLRREFGQVILDLKSRFAQALPANKHLTKVELLHLCNWLDAHHRWCSSRFRFTAWIHFWRGLSCLNKQLRMHHFDGVGFRTGETYDSDEVLIFNPSRIVPLSVHRTNDWRYDCRDFPIAVRLRPAIPVPELREISERAAAEEEREFRELQALGEPEK